MLQSLCPASPPPSASQPALLRAPSPQERETIRALEGRVSQARAAAPGGAGPLFAAMDLEIGGRRRPFLLGGRTAVHPAITLLDWRRAPLAEVYFSCAPGDAYEVDAGDRTLEGILLERWALGFCGEELCAIRSPEVTFRRDPRLGWAAGPTSERAPLHPREAALRRQLRGPLEIVLDPAQREAVALPGDEPLLILGEAGFGKTTVAVHRVARLAEEARAAGRPFSALILVPTPGLRALTRALLDDLRVEGARVEVVDTLLAAEGRRLFPGLPEGDSRDATAAVIRVKRSPALGPLLAELARHPMGGADAHRLARARRRGGDGPLRRLDLLHLFGDRAVLDHLAAADPALTLYAREEILEHTRVQFSQRTEDAFADVDPDRLHTADGAAIDEGTPMQDAGTLDAEDFPLLFELHRLREGGGPAPGGSLQTFDHVVVDEAQELAPLELRLIGRMSASPGALTVVGDERQQVDETAFFKGWDATLASLGIPHAARRVLAVGYRCPPRVTAWARAVVAGEAPPPPFPREGLAVTSHGGLFHLVEALVRGLDALMAADPRGTAALICRSPASASALFELLERALPVRLASGGRFGVPGLIDVTCVEEVKGLEFDYVVIPDLGGGAWPDDPRTRRMLYVAATRATHGLWLAGLAGASGGLSGALGI